VQVDPIKPTLKAPGTTRLKLNHEEVRSSFAFKFKLRRYIMEGGDAVWVARLRSATGRGLHSFPFPLNLSSSDHFYNPT
jgi:hypothetical protein